MSNQNSERYLQLQSFLQHYGLEHLQLSSLNGDASFRRYFRADIAPDLLQKLCEQAKVSLNLKANLQSIIIVDSPPQTQKNKEFVAINALLDEAKINVSTIIAQDLEQGFFILEDLGVTSFYDQAVLKDNVMFYYNALIELAKITSLPFNEEQRLSLEDAYQCALKAGNGDEELVPVYNLSQQSLDTLNNLPLFDEPFIKMELNIFTEWLLDKALHLELSDAEKAMLEQTWDFLTHSCLNQRQTAMHRDYHSRNIMVCKQEHNPQSVLAVIDYQDMVKGPMCYDLASLLYDCYANLPDARRERLISFAYAMFVVCKMVDDQSIGLAKFAENIKLCALQRHIKVLGLFNRLNLRDGKKGYLKDLPLVLNYVLDNCSNFSEMRPFKDFILNRVKDPLLKMVAENR